MPPHFSERADPSCTSTWIKRMGTTGPAVRGVANARCASSPGHECRTRHESRSTARLNVACQWCMAHGPTHNDSPSNVSYVVVQPVLPDVPWRTTRCTVFDHAVPRVGPRGASYWTTRCLAFDHAVPGVGPRVVARDFIPPQARPACPVLGQARPGTGDAVPSWLDPTSSTRPPWSGFWFERPGQRRAVSPCTGRARH